MKKNRLLGLCLVLAASLLAGAPARAQQPTGPQNLDVVLVVDQSGSMWERSDPQILAPDGSVKNSGWRIAAANLLAEWLATDQTGAQHQLSVIMFGTDAKVVFPLQSIQTEEAQTAFQKALRENHRSHGATDILEALQLAGAELDKGRPGVGARRVTILLSDGVCEPEPETSTQERLACERDIRQLVQREHVAGEGGPIFTIALTSDAFKRSRSSTIYKNLWQEIAVTTGGEYYEPAQAEHELVVAVVSVLQRLFGLPAQSLAPPVDAPAELTVDLPGDLAQAGFTAIKYDPQISMTVYRPDGAAVQPGDPDAQHAKSALTESYSISQPPGGAWKVKLSGKGKALLLTVPYARAQLALDHAQPAAAHPQGKPMDIRVRVLDAGRNAQTPRDFKVDAVLPDGTQVTLPLTAAGSYYTAVLDDTRQAGAYTLRYSGQLNGRAFGDQQSIQVVPAPWLKMLQPSGPQGPFQSLAVPVQAQLMLGDQPVQRLDPADRIEVVARLHTAAGRVADTRLLLPAGGIFSGTLAAGDAGDYVASVQLVYIPPSGERFQDTTETAFRVGGAAASAPAAGAGTIALQAAAPPKPAETGFQPAEVPPPADPTLDLNPVYLAIAGLAAILLVSLLLLAGAVNGIKRTYQKSLNQQSVALRDQRARDLSFQLQTDQGWLIIASQIIADALRENTAVDGDCGILQAVADPSPRFSVVTRDGREVVFTTDVPFMKKAKLIRRGDRVIDVSTVSPTSHADAGTLWSYVLATRNMWYVAPPASAHWHIVIRAASARPAGRHALAPGAPRRTARGLLGSGAAPACWM